MKPSRHQRPMHSDWSNQRFYQWINFISGYCFIEQVTGILFEMKVDYTTWFGAEVEYIHGIQVSDLPILSSIRAKPAFTNANKCVPCEFSAIPIGFNFYEFWGLSGDTNCARNFIYGTL